MVSGTARSAKTSVQPGVSVAPVPTPARIVCPNGSNRISKAPTWPSADESQASRPVGCTSGPCGIWAAPMNSFDPLVANRYPLLSVKSQVVLEMSGETSQAVTTYCESPVTPNEGLESAEPAAAA